MKDQRFLPADKREPVEDYDDYAEESSDADELFIGGDAEAEEIQMLDHNGKKTHKDVLYIAS
ncbi:hypothetical protein HYV85_03890 [Candidatus Woesearchaeota archaeon]|nr:hypothetical protein [Candidatus Woesearchaeota archaeon]